MQQGTTLKTATLQLFQNAVYLPFWSVLNLHVFIYDVRDSAICGSTDYTADRKTVVAWKVYTFSNETCGFISTSSLIISFENWHSLYKKVTFLQARQKIFLQGFKNTIMSKTRHSLDK